MKSIIGITGGIASGKSFVCTILKEQGFTVIDADEISRELSKRGNPLYEKIIECFGKEYVNLDGDLDRKSFGKMIFENEVERRKLNDISHPLIVEEMKKRIDRNPSSIIFLDIPLLFEAKLSYLCDKIVCVYVNQTTQIERLRKRDGISKAYALQKIDAQIPLEQKKMMSDYIIESKESFEDTRQETLKTIKKIMEDTYVND